MIARIFLSVAVLVSSLGFTRAAVLTAAAPTISNIQILTANLAVFDRFEVRFDLQTSAQNPDLPYDPQPPKGLEEITGVSVDAIFTSPGGKRISQPAFYYQPVTITDVDGQDHRIPAGKPYWLVRFTPQEEGRWELRLRAVDAGGMSLVPMLTPLIFTVSGRSSNPYQQHGFLRVSPKDARYFEFEDGAPFIGTGFNTGFGSLSQAGQQMTQLESSRINFIRTWLSGEGINGSQWSPWASFTLPYNGYLPGVSFETRDTFPGHELAFKLDNTSACLFQGWQGGPVPVDPATTYTIWARVKVKDVGREGFVIKTGGWLQDNCNQAGQGSALTPPLSGSSGWTEVTGTIQTAPGQHWLDNLYLARQGASGTALVDEVRLYRAEDQNQVNILRQPSPDSHLSFDPPGAARWDALLELAAQHGVYLKLVIDEKSEWIRDHISADGAFMDQGDNNNFYAAPGTKVRWLEQAWWRYIIARWGYSTAIHSFEYINEGDPYNGRHYEAANAMAIYFHRFDPAHHMVTTSFWHSFPNQEFWSNPAYAEIDYADLHAYLSTGWPDGKAVFASRFKLDTTPTNTRTAPASIRIDAASTGSSEITPRGLVLREKGEWIVRYWMKAAGFSVSCPYNTSGGMQRVRWMVDGGPSNGGQQGVAPPDLAGQDFICTSPAGSFDWKQFRSDQDLHGRVVPQQARLVISDNQPHEISLSIENLNSTSGTAWISDVELVSPSGKVVPVIGQFDPTAMNLDTAWYNAAYGLLLGGGSPVGAQKPLVRGEGAINSAEQDGYWPDLNKDKQGIWLHNNLWAQLGPGGMADLLWWADETISENPKTGRVPGLYPLYLNYQNFMTGIPINNGRYQEARAQVSDARLRAWGQRDDSAGNAYLWIQNTAHTWRAVVDRQTIAALPAKVTLPDMAAGSYQVQWWDTYAAGGKVTKTETVTARSDGLLVLTLPAPLADDLAVKISRQ